MREAFFFHLFSENISKNFGFGNPLRAWIQKSSHHGTILLLPLSPFSSSSLHSLPLTPGHKIQCCSRSRRMAYLFVVIFLFLTCQSFFPFSLYFSLSLTFPAGFLILMVVKTLINFLWDQKRLAFCLSQLLDRGLGEVTWHLLVSGPQSVKWIE